MTRIDKFIEFGGDKRVETPVLIPNPEAKPFSADGTAQETGSESRSPPDNHSQKGDLHQGPPFGVSVAAKNTRLTGILGVQFGGTRVG